MTQSTRRLSAGGSHDPRGQNAYASVVTNGKGRRFINWIPYVNRDSLGTADIYAEKRPGFASALTISTSLDHAIQLYWWESGGRIICSFSDLATTGKIYKIAQSGSALAATLMDTNVGGSAGSLDNQSFSETTVSGTPYLVLVTGGGKLFYSSSTTFTEATGTGYPTGLIRGPAVHMDGWTFVLDPTNSKIYNTDLNSFAFSSAAQYITPDDYPDAPVSIRRTKDLLVCFGSESIQFFRNAGNPAGSPLNRVGGSTIILGTTYNSSPASNTRHGNILSWGDTLYFVSVNNRGGYGIHSLTGQTVEKVSTSIVDDIIGSAVVGGNNLPVWKLSGCYLFGRRCLFVSETVAGLTLGCNLDDGIWFEVAPASASHNFFWFLCMSKITTPSGDVMPNAVYSLDYTDGATLYTIPTASPVYTDNGSAYTATLQTRNIDMEQSNRIFWTRLSVEADTQSSTSNLGVSWSDDDYATFSTVQNIDTSQTVKRLFRLGSSPNARAYKFTHSANTPARLKSLTFDYYTANR